MRLEENVVRCAVLSDDPRHVIALLLFARGVLMARSDDDQVAFGRSVEQGGEFVVIEARHVVEQPAGRFGQCRQHLVGLNEEGQDIAGIEVKERIPDSVLEQADEVVNIDLTADELVARLKAGKIYKPEKVQTALNNFFKAENILQLRELALKEVALRVEKKVENSVPVNTGVRHERFLACISSHEKTPRKVIRKAARLATRYNSKFYVLYVQTPRESMDRIPLANQRYLSNHFKLATELGGEVIRIQSESIPKSIVRVCREKQISTVCVGKPSFSLRSVLLSVFQYRTLLNSLSQLNIDLIIIA